MDWLEDVLGPIVVLLIIAFRFLLRGMGQRQSDDRPSPPTHRQDRDYRPQPQEPRRNSNSDADPFETLRRRIEEAANRRQHEHQQPQPQQRPQPSTAQQRPTHQQRPAYQPQQQHRPQPQVQHQRVEQRPAPQPRREPEPVMQSRQAERHVRPTVVHQQTRQRAHTHVAPEFSAEQTLHTPEQRTRARTRTRKMPERAMYEPRRQPMTGKGMARIERLPKLKQAILLSEVLGKPRGLQGF